MALSDKLAGLKQYGGMSPRGELYEFRKRVIHEA
jgi:hypothetical protein